MVINHLLNGKILQVWYPIGMDISYDVPVVSNPQKEHLHIRIANLSGSKSFKFSMKDRFSLSGLFRILQNTFAY